MQRSLSARPARCSPSSSARDRVWLSSTGPTAAAVLVYVVGLSAAACSRRATTEGAAPTPAVVPVTVATVKSQEQPVTIEATGSFEADESSDVAPDSSGRVVATPVVPATGERLLLP